ncbi:MAG: methyltransferase domain-containing protein [Lentisphaerae bacterium]|nr:methyltransferase domain-containing protein [Lentisphaerota bacterium]
MGQLFWGRRAQWPQPACNAERSTAGRQAEALRRARPCVAPFTINAEGLLANETKACAARFSAAAASYHAAAAVQRAVAARLSALLARDKAPERILEIGCGTGLLTEHLCRLFPGTRIDALDMAGGMVEQCRSRLGSKPGLHCRVTELSAFCPDAPYALIVSSAALHWLYPLGDFMAMAASWLEHQGSLVFALMVRGTLAELHAARARVAPHKPPERYLPTESDVHNALVQAGLSIEGEWRELQRETYASAEDFFRQLHNQGVTSGPLARAGRLLNRSELLHLKHDYEKHYRHNGGVYANYRISYFRARKC